MKLLLVSCVVWLYGLGLVVAQSVPQVIPMLQQWKSAKIIVSSHREEALKQSAEILVQDLKTMFGWDYWGTRTLLQMIHNQSEGLDEGADDGFSFVSES